jgi:[histone H3]-lysine79 N-trimethyltransferase
MNPAFVSLVAQQTSLSSNSTFVDLGSGVGNCVLQVALQTGAASYGCESQPNPSQMAKLQLAEARRRWAMWGLEGGDAEVWEGDFCESPKVARVLQQADLVVSSVQLDTLLSGLTLLGLD